MNAIDKFAAESEAFAQWAEGRNEPNVAPARDALVRLLRLYCTALELPPAASDNDNHQERVNQSEWELVFKNAARLPLDYYAEVFNPLIIPGEEPVVGSLSDDIADIYRDVVTGLKYYRAGRHQQAAWEWTFRLESHWGEQITGAIRVLHWWLATNDPERLAAESE